MNASSVNVFKDAIENIPDMNKHILKSRYTLPGPLVWTAIAAMVKQFKLFYMAYKKISKHFTLFTFVCHPLNVETLRIPSARHCVC